MALGRGSQGEGAMGAISLVSPLRQQRFRSDFSARQHGERLRSPRAVQDEGGWNVGGGSHVSGKLSEITGFVLSWSLSLSLSLSLCLSLSLSLCLYFYFSTCPSLIKVSYRRYRLRCGLRWSRADLRPERARSARSLGSSGCETSGCANAADVEGKDRGHGRGKRTALALPPPPRNSGRLAPLFFSVSVRRVRWLVLHIALVATLVMIDAYREDSYEP